MMKEKKEKMSLNEPVSIDEAITLCPHEFIVMKVTEFDQNHSPTRGIIVAHGTDENVVNEQLSKSEESDAHYYFFTGYRRIHTDEELMQAIEETKDKGADVHRLW
jgi:hypothetical protein